MESYETAAPPSRRTDDQLSEHARELVLAMMASATTERISPMDWWPRAKSALLSAVARARTWGDVVEGMARKLEIETLRAESARAVFSNALSVDDVKGFRRVVQREATYIIAEAQVMQRAADAAAKENAK